MQEFINVKSLNESQKKAIQDYKLKYDEKFEFYKFETTLDSLIETLVIEANDRKVKDFNMYEGNTSQEIHSSLRTLFLLLRSLRDEKS